MNIDSIQLIISLITVVGAGLSAYVGVKIAIAEIKTEIKWHTEKIQEMQKDIERLEQNTIFRNK